MNICTKCGFDIIIISGSYVTQTKHDRKPTTDNGQRQGYGISSPKVSQKTMILSGQQNQTDLDSKSGHTNCSIREPKCYESINNCTTATCRYCPLFNNSDTITSHSTKRAYMTRRKVSCRCTNLVYCITCKQCSKQYEGQVKHRLMYRFQAHLQLSVKWMTLVVDILVFQATTKLMI